LRRQLTGAHWQALRCKRPAASACALGLRLPLRLYIGTSLYTSSLIYRYIARARTGTRACALEPACACACAAEAPQTRAAAATPTLLPTPPNTTQHHPTQPPTAHQQRRMQLAGRAGRPAAARVHVPVAIALAGRRTEAGCPTCEAHAITAARCQKSCRQGSLCGAMLWVYHCFGHRSRTRHRM
jgi:hypothetical protein